MAVPAPQETLPPELIEEVISALLVRPRHPTVFDTFNSVMQTSRAMRVICSGFITRLEVKDSGALASFPRHAVVKSLRLNLGSALATNENLYWLSTSLLALPSPYQPTNQLYFRPTSGIVVLVPSTGSGVSNLAESHPRL